MKKYFLGIDGGGTKTVFLLADLDGSVVNRVVKGGSNPNDIGMEQAKSVLKEGIEEVLGDIPCHRVTMFAGLSGGGLTGNNGEVLKDFFKTFGFETFENGSDIENLIGLADCKKGILVIMGTGFIVYAINGGEQKRISGWGQFFDEGGSGYTIGRDGIAAALSAWDGSGEKTILTSLLEEKIGESVQEHVAEFYRGGKRYIAGFAKEVFEAARLNDLTAQKILEKNMAFAAQKIRTAAIELCKDADGNVQEPIPVWFAGGVSNKWKILFPMIDSSVKMPRCILKRLEQEPVEGALKRAYQLKKEKKGEGENESNRD